MNKIMQLLVSPPARALAAWIAAVAAVLALAAGPNDNDTAVTVVVIAPSPLSCEPHHAGLPSLL